MNKATKQTTFFYLILAAGSFLSIVIGFSALSGSAATPVVQDMRGVWDGFVQVVGEAGCPCFRTEITGQTNRQFTGILNDGVQNVQNTIEGTVSASGNVHFKGQSTEGRIMGKSDLLDFGGGAAVLNGSLTRHSNDGIINDGTFLSLRPFAGEAGCPCFRPGRYVGTLSDGGGTTGQINMVLDPPARNPASFGGSMEIVLSGQTHTFQLLGTVNGDGRIIAIAQTAAGHVILDAVLATPPDTSRPTINGGFTLEFGDGSVLEGTFDSTFTPSTVSERDFAL